MNKTRVIFYAPLTQPEARWQRLSCGLLQEIEWKRPIDLSVIAMAKPKLILSLYSKRAYSICKMGSI